MKRAFFACLLLLISHLLFAQNQSRTVRATSPIVDIRVGDEYYWIGGWHLEPAKSPDTFSIGSKWPYETKKVTFYTDIDSIAIDVRPGSRNHFTIHLNDVPCLIQVATLADPVFLSKKIALPILFAFVLLCSALAFVRHRINVKALLSIGYLAPLLFWCMTLISGFVHGNYNHLKNVISELGAIGTSSEVLTSASLMLLAFLCILFSTGFFLASKKLNISVIPAILSFAMPLSMIIAGIFPLGNEIHNMSGPLPFLVIFAYFLAFLLWYRIDGMLKLTQISLACFFIAMLIILRFVKPFGYEYEGTVQRFFYLSWTIWTMSIAHYLLKRLNAGSHR